MLLFVIRFRNLRRPWTDLKNRKESSMKRRSCSVKVRKELLALVWREGKWRFDVKITTFHAVYMKWPFPLSEMCCQWRGFTSRKDSLLDFSPSYKQVCYRPHKLTSRDTSMAKWTCEEITSNSFVFTSLLYFCVVVNLDSVYSSLTVFVNYLIVSGCLSTVFNLSVES